MLLRRKQLLALHFDSVCLRRRSGAPNYPLLPVTREDTPATVKTYSNELELFIFHCCYCFYLCARNNTLDYHESATSLLHGLSSSFSFSSTLYSLSTRYCSKQTNKPPTGHTKQQQHPLPICSSHTSLVASFSLPHTYSLPRRPHYPSLPQPLAQNNEQDSASGKRECEEGEQGRNQTKFDRIAVILLLTLYPCTPTHTHTHTLFLNRPNGSSSFCLGIEPFSLNPMPNPPCVCDVAATRGSPCYPLSLSPPTPSLFHSLMIGAN